MSFNIGGIRNIEDVGRDSFRTMAGMVGLGEKLALGVYDEVLSKFEASVRESARELADIGFENAINIGDRILHSRKRIL